MVLVYNTEVWSVVRKTDHKYGELQGGKQRWVLSVVGLWLASRIKSLVMSAGNLNSDGEVEEDFLDFPVGVQQGVRQQTERVTVALSFSFLHVSFFSRTFWHFFFPT